MVLGQNVNKLEACNDELLMQGALNLAYTCSIDMHYYNSYMYTLEGHMIDKHYRHIHVLQTCMMV
jgi:hypothetical protein